VPQFRATTKLEHLWSGFCNKQSALHSQSMLYKGRISFLPFFLCVATAKG